LALEEAAMAVKFKSLRTNFHCQLPFKRPLLVFSNAADRFFSMMYDCLAGKIPVRASEFSGRVGLNLGEAFGRLRPPKKISF
jgi:hypothetical protein